MLIAGAYLTRSHMNVSLYSMCFFSPRCEPSSRSVVLHHLFSFPFDAFVPFLPNLSGYSRVEVSRPYGPFSIFLYYHCGNSSLLFRLVYNWFIFDQPVLIKLIKNNISHPVETRAITANIGFRIWQDKLYKHSEEHLSVPIQAHGRFIALTPKETGRFN